MRSAIEGPLGHVVRDQIFKLEVMREAQFVQAQRERTNLRLSAEHKFIRELQSRVEETFFILGSGSSVEDDASRRFATISTGVSVGVNAWVLHDFVPTFYCFEPDPRPESDHFKTLSHLSRPEVFEAMPAIMILRPRNAMEFEQIQQLPETLVPRALVYGRVSVATRDRRHLSRDTAVAIRYLTARRSPIVTLDSGASIVRMTSLAIQLGFTKIVYVGVDLNHTEYFWERNPSYLERRGLVSFESGQKGSRHETLNPDSRPFPVTELILAIRDGLMAKGLVRLYSGSATSELAKFLPVFPW